MASLRFLFAEHEFMEARSASFRIFQLVFGCGCICVVYLVCMSRVRVLCDCLSLMCFHGCLFMFEMQKYFQNCHVHDDLQWTEVKPFKG